MLLHLGSKPVLIVSSANAAQEVLRTHDLTFSNRPQPSFAGRLFYNFKDVSFAPYGEYWRQVRSICVLQLLSNKRVQSFKGVREEEIALMLEKVGDSCSPRSVIVIGKILATLTNDIVSRVAIGRRYSVEGVGSRFKEMFEEFDKLLGVFNVGDYIPWLAWINHINGLEAKVTRVAKEFDEYLENIVEEGIKRQENRARNGGKGEEEKEQQNFIVVLREIQRTNAAGLAIGRDSIKAIITDMFVGGTDTTSTLLEWAFAELLKNTSAMIQLQNELRQQFSDSKPQIIAEDDLEKLPYLKAVIKETFRMHPPVPLLVPRESTKAAIVLGCHIPAGTQVIVNAWAIGRDSSSWEDGDEFRPERFLNSSGIDVKGQHFALIPFGSGRRSCPGMGFALVTAELALANLIRNFDFALAGGKFERVEELDMTEAPGIITPRKIPLQLIATLPNYE